MATRRTRTISGSPPVSRSSIEERERCHADDPSLAEEAGARGGIALALVYVVFAAYSLPRHAKVRVTGTEIARRDVESRSGRTRTEDVRYVMAEDLEGQPRMFRNEDTGWGWPPYFKFDTGDITAQATNYAIDAASGNGPQPVVLVRYYGFRIRMLSMFPNIVSMRTVPADYQRSPGSRSSSSSPPGPDRLPGDPAPRPSRGSGRTGLTGSPGAPEGPGNKGRVRWA